MEVTGDAIAEVVLSQFARLPSKRKPQSRGDGVREWVPLSGIVVQDENGLRCIALGTGMKCLPQSKITQTNGVVLHDWHAEIIAIRGFNRFLLDEIKIINTAGEHSDIVRLREESEITEEYFQPFSIKDGVKFHMYCSEAPCGDASMELIMAAQDDDTPWEIPISDDAALEGSLNGRGFFSQLGVVRRKPSRPDAPPTISKSCSDKISLHQCTSLLSSIVSLFVVPEDCYIQTLTLPESQYSSISCTRAFSKDGRMSALNNSSWDGGYGFLPFCTQTTAREFAFSRRNANGDKKIVPSNLAAVWTPHGEETLIGGVLQGRKQFDARGASFLCKRSMWTMARELAATAECSNISVALMGEVYNQVKASSLLGNRRQVKKDARNTLQGWVRNQGDQFTLLQPLLGRSSEYHLSRPG